MLRTYILEGGRLRLSEPGEAGPRAVWYDLLNPTSEEEKSLEAQLGIQLPTREEMKEIELSSRLYTERGGTYMTALVLSHTDGDDILIDPITFILCDDRLVTIRYTEPRAFALFPARAEASDVPLSDGQDVLLGLLEAVIDRLADVLERAGHDIDTISREVFGIGGTTRRKDASYKATLTGIGRKGDLTSHIRDSLATLERMAAYVGPKLKGADAAQREQLAALSADIRSLSDHLEYIAQKITFLLDATLGLINIEQNGIIKIFSVAAVVFLPPTLVASIYGMNFDVMPELGWRFGYPMAIGLMILSAILPYLYFKRRGWL